MKNIYILGYNNLGSEFWGKHLTISSEQRLLFFRDGKILLDNLDKRPPMIIVDGYFCENIENDEFNFKDLVIALSLLTPDTPCFFLSPAYTGKTKKSKKLNHFFSNFNEVIISHLNKEINDLSKIEKAA